MDRKLYFSCLCPGLPELWYRGRLSALPQAIAFTAAINFLLIAKFVYPEWLASGLVRMAGWVGLAVWLYCVVRGLREMPALLFPRSASDQPDRFHDAHQAYLRGDWGEAESQLALCLGVENRDPPALILLAGVYRHTARFEAAERLIEEIRLTEAADRWWLEVAAEEKRLRRDLEYARSATSSLPAVDRGDRQPVENHHPAEDRQQDDSSQQVNRGEVAEVSEVGGGQSERSGASSRPPSAGTAEANRAA